MSLRRLCCLNLGDSLIEKHLLSMPKFPPFPNPGQVSARRGRAVKMNHLKNKEQINRPKTLKNQNPRPLALANIEHDAIVDGPVSCRKVFCSRSDTFVVLLRRVGVIIEAYPGVIELLSPRAESNDTGFLSCCVMKINKMKVVHRAPSTMWRWRG